jgi:hypothetical protein
MSDTTIWSQFGKYQNSFPSELVGLALAKLIIKDIRCWPEEEEWSSVIRHPSSVIWLSINFAMSFQILMKYRNVKIWQNCGYFQVGTNRVMSRDEDWAGMIRRWSNHQIVESSKNRSVEWSMRKLMQLRMQSRYFFGFQIVASFRWWYTKIDRQFANRDRYYISEFDIEIDIVRQWKVHAAWSIAFFSIES